MTIAFSPILGNGGFRPEEVARGDQQRGALLESLWSELLTTRAWCRTTDPLLAPVFSALGHDPVVRITQAHWGLILAALDEGLALLPDAPATRSLIETTARQVEAVLECLRSAAARHGASDLLDQLQSLALRPALAARLRRDEEQWPRRWSERSLSEQELARARQRFRRSAAYRAHCTCFPLPPELSGQDAPRD
ncbi:MAG: hypothetical protein RMJ05_09785 [Thermomicrobium sp.]|nr:hypothetical protein [Thermomicrobium sp.]MDW8006997.1 hypothetical protein [Thermomicrobium sp.]